MKTEITLAGVDNSTPTPDAEESVEVRQEYKKFINCSKDSNKRAYEFAQYLNSLLASGKTSVRQAKKTMANTLGGSEFKPTVLPSHVQHIPTLCLLVEGISDTIAQPISKAFGLSHRVDSWKGAGNAKKTIGKAKTFQELNSQVPTKAEITALARGEEVVAVKDSIAEAVTLESIIDLVNDYLTKQDLRTFKTVELQKLDSVIARLVTISKNSKTA